MTPNSLRILDELGVYKDTTDEMYRFESVKVRNTAQEVVSTMIMGDERRHGYKAARVFRDALNKALRNRLRENKIPIHFTKSFQRIVKEDCAGVEFEFRDRSRHSAALLVGADGIYSSVRKYLYPDAQPVFSGALAVFAELDGTNIVVPDTSSEDYFPCLMQGAHPGVAMFPQTTDRSSFLMFAQKFGHPDLGRAGFEALNEDKAKLREMILEHSEYWPNPVKSAMEQMPDEGLFIWAFTSLPKLDTWISKDQKVLILGDAAHALLPSAAQGVNQAVEDCYTLGILFGNVWSNDVINMSDALDFWQRSRQARIELVEKLAHDNLQARLPEAQRKVIPGLDELGSAEARYTWLLCPDLCKETEDWVREQVAK